jgi:hypothetical protein
MGFALWIDDAVAWAQGTSEYRAMGTAVISASDVFQNRDFRPRRRLPRMQHESYRGMFASLGEMNAHLARYRRNRRQARTASSFQL